MAKLNFKYSTMNAGKTLDLIRTVYNYEENGYNVLVLKPKIDTKGDNYIVSRVGVKRKVDYSIGADDKIIDILSGHLANIKTIFVDEAQFLKREQVDELFLISKKCDIDVICYGLRLDFQMNAFEGSMRLLEIAEELDELKTMCHCGNIARYVGRKVNGEYVSDGDIVVIDGTKNVEYIPLCGDCYLQEVKKVDLTNEKEVQKIKYIHK
jgi:thymidine kinase